MEKTLLFDGAMGTYLAQKYNIDVTHCEMVNLEHPEYVEAVHREYITAGAQAIKTNTFAANRISLSLAQDKVFEIIETACRIAKQAAAEGAEVFASIGQIPGDFDLMEYGKLIECFFANGVDRFLFETFDSPEPLAEVAEYVKGKNADSFVICEGRIMPDGYTAVGVSAQSMIDHLYECAAIDVYGFNCASGPMHMRRIVKETEFYDKPVSIMPNAGYPTVVSGRTLFDSSPEYFAQQLMGIGREGVAFLGGCCGTAPAHIKAVRRAIEAGGGYQQPQAHVYVKNIRERPVVRKKQNKPLVVELDSPFDSQGKQFFEHAQMLHKAGADTLTIADCPIGRARADSSMLAAHLRQAHGIPVIPHLTCRDRNLNATKALLLGLHMQGIEDVLVVTGDPLPTADMAKSIYHFNSVRLAEFINELNHTIFSDRPFGVRGALNLNVRNFDLELKKAQKKVDAGVSCFLTQPVFDDRAVERLQQAKQELGVDILAGIMPVVSYKNACFLNNEVPGITVGPELMGKYENATKEEATEIAVVSSLETAGKTKDVSDGFYIMTPLRRVDIVCELLKGLKA